MSESLADVVHEAVERAKADSVLTIGQIVWLALNGYPVTPGDTKRLAEALVAERAKVAQVLEQHGHADTCALVLSPDLDDPCTCWRADLADWQHCGLGPCSGRAGHEGPCVL